MSSVAKACIFSSQRCIHQLLKVNFKPRIIDIAGINHNSDQNIDPCTKNKELVAPRNILPLHERGIFQEIYPPASVNLPKLFQKKQCFYCGFDPTADSLHIGNLLSIMALLHCQRAGKFYHHVFCDVVVFFFFVINSTNALKIDKNLLNTSIGI